MKKSIKLNRKKSKTQITKIPKFQRKLIEKYSTRRYNLNAKFIRLTPLYLKRKKQLYVTKINRRADRRLAVELSSKEKADKEIFPNFFHFSSFTCDHEEQGADRENERANTQLQTIERNVEREERLDEVEKSKPYLSFQDSIVNSENDSSTSNTALNKSSHVNCKKYKIVSSEFYNYLSTVKPDLQKKNVRSRRNRTILSMKKKKKKSKEIDKNLCASYTDPYINGWYDGNPNKKQIKENIMLLVYLGVGRPLYPVIHRNIVKICQQKSTEITDGWAEFSLSTLVENPADVCVKPILMPVVDTKLFTTVMEFNKIWKQDFTETECIKTGNPYISYKDLKLIRSPINLNCDASPTKKMNAPQTICEPISKVQLNTYNNCSRTTRHSSKIVFDEQYLRERGFKPCYVIAPKLEDMKSMDVLKPNRRTRLKQISNNGTLSKLVDLESHLDEDKSISLSKHNRKTTSKLISNDKILSPTVKSSGSQLEKRKSISISSEKLALPKVKSPQSRLEKSKSISPLKRKREVTPKQTPDTKISPNIDRTLESLLQEEITDLVLLPKRRRKQVLRFTSDYEISNKEKEVSKPSPKKTVSPKKEVLLKNSPVHIETTNMKLPLQESIPNVDSSQPIDTASSIKQVADQLPDKFPVSSNNVAYIENDTCLLENHYFGFNNCCRTYGPMIDYLIRNKSIVYFYKMRRMMKFQRTNNKYFQSCVYVSIQKPSPDDESDHIDVFSTTFDNCLVDENSEETSTLNNTSGKRAASRSLFGSSNINILRVKKPTCKSENPLEIIRFPNNTNLFGSTLVKNNFNQNQYPIRFVDNIQDHTLHNGKWILLKLDEDVREIILGNSLKLDAEVLFEIMYRADLTKKVVRFEVSKVDHSKFPDYGVYGIPGLCNTILFGPYQSREKCISLKATVKRNPVQFELIDISVSTSKFTFLKTHDYKIETTWWRPGSTPSTIGDIHAAYLNFIFNWPQNSTPLGEIINMTRLSKLLREHKAISFVKYGSEPNYVLCHSSQDHISNSLPSDVTSKSSRRPHDNLHSFGIAEEQGGKYRRFTSNHIKSYNRYNFKLRNLNNKREQYRRLVFRQNCDTLREVVFFYDKNTKRNTNQHIPVQHVLTEATRVIDILNYKNMEFLREKERLLMHRKRLIRKWGVLLKEMDKLNMKYPSRNELMPYLMLPNNEEKVNKEYEKLLEEESQIIMTDLDCTKTDAELDEMIKNLTNSRCATKRAKRSKRRRRKRQHESQQKLPQDRIPFRITVESITTEKNSSKVFGPYDEHNYSTFLNAVSRKKEEDPLAETNTYKIFLDINNLVDAMNNFELLESEFVLKDEVHICLTDGGKPVINLLINRAQTENFPVQTSDAMRKLIKNILFKIQDQFNAESLNLSKDYVHQMSNVLYNIQKESLKSSNDENFRKSYTSNGVFTNGSNKNVCDSPANFFFEFFETEDDNYKKNYLPTPDDTLKFVSINSLIKNHESFFGNDVENIEETVLSSNNVLDYQTCISNSNDVDTKLQNEECVLQDQYIDNKLSIVDSDSYNNTNSLGFSLKTRKAMLSILTVKENNVRQQSNVVHSLPVRRRLKVIPVLKKISLDKYRANVFKIRSVASSSVILPKIVPSQISRHEETENVQFSTRNAADENDGNATNFSPESYEENLPFDSIGDSDDSSTEESNCFSSTESTTSSCHLDTYVDSGNESDISHRVSIKSFASIQSFKSRVKTTVGRLLKS